MNYVPTAAVAAVMGLLIGIWAITLHMILSHAPDPHLQFFLDLVERNEERLRG